MNETINKTQMFMYCLDALYYDGVYSIHYEMDTNEFYRQLGIITKYTAFVSKDEVKRKARRWILNNIHIQ